jgi:hypothetical protein
VRSKKSEEGMVDGDYYFDDPIDAAPPQRRRRTRLFSSLALLLGTALFFQTTLAANISLNSGQPIQFGQGLTQTAACSGNTNLLITPMASFSNSSGSGSYYLSSIKVSNIPDSCFGSDFILKAFGNSNSSALAIFNTSSTDAVIYNNAGTFQLGSGSTGMTVSSGSGQFTATFTAPVATTESVFKVTIQSTPNASVSCALGGSCTVGDTGPGGGKVFYVSVGGFSCGVSTAATCNYLEISPTNWSGGADPSRSWAQSTPVNYTSASLTVSELIGFGAQNTKAIIDQGNSNTSSSAAALAASYTPVVNGTTVNDWFLPSENEMMQVWNQRTAIGFVASGNNYWNSSSRASTNGRFSIFGGGFEGTSSGALKTTSYLVRPVRAF